MIISPKFVLLDDTNNLADRTVTGVTSQSAAHCCFVSFSGLRCFCLCWSIPSTLAGSLGLRCIAFSFSGVCTCGLGSWGLVGPPSATPLAGSALFCVGYVYFILSILILFIFEL